MRYRKPSGRNGSRTEYFMSQKIMRRTRHEADIMLSIVKRKKNTDGAFVTFPMKCGCGCGPVGIVRYER